MRTSRFVTFVRSLARHAGGQDLVEYGLLLGMASTVVILALTQISTKIVDVYGDTMTEIASGGVPAGGGGGAADGGGDGGGGDTGGDTGGPGRGGGPK